MRAVNSTVLKVQQVGAAQVGQQGCVQARPDARLGPVPKPAPGRHPGTADRFGRDVAPGDTGPQHEHDPGECRPVGNAQSAGVAAATLRSGRQERSHALPQVIRNKISTHPDTLPMKITGHKTCESSRSETISKPSCLRRSEARRYLSAPILFRIHSGSG